MPLTHMSALVTGANRGLGRAIADRLVAAGTDVMLTARDEPLLREVAQQLDGQGPRVLYQRADVSNPGDVHAVFEQTLIAFGRLDALVCNAGVYGPIGRIEDVDWLEWANAVNINLAGTVLCCREAVPAMRRQRAGKIVIISGGGATKPLPRFSAYAASKAAVVRFAETLALEVQDDGIDVNAIAPGALNTRLLDEVLAAGAERAGADFYASSLRQQAAGGTPLDVPADLVAFLASPESNGITGRLIAAVWDDWRHLPEKRARLTESDVYTLRRILPEDRGWPAE